MARHRTEIQFFFGVRRRRAPERVHEWLHCQLRRTITESSANDNDPTREPLRSNGLHFVETHFIPILTTEKPAALQLFLIMQAFKQ
jgi:hypothetical protein